MTNKQDLIKLLKDTDSLNPWHFECIQDYKDSNKVKLGIINDQTGELKHIELYINDFDKLYTLFVYLGADNENEYPSMDKFVNNILKLLEGIPNDN